MMAQVRRNVIYNVYVFEPAKARPADGARKEEVKTAKA